MNQADKLEDLKKRIAEKGKLLVACSGGVDSSLLAKVAHEVLGDGALTVILDSETMPRSELFQAMALAKSQGLNCQTAEFSILANEHFVQNPANRCYICKKESAAILKSIAAKKGISCIADGVNLSDYRDYRPGIAACDEEGIWHPFVDARITKEDIRALAHSLGLPVWNKPSSACLSSRIPYGESITSENLRMVEEAEEYLKSLGFGQLRVRVHGRMARIELLKQDMSGAIEESDEIARMLRSIGFDYVALDLQGFRSGSMNEVSEIEVLWTSGK
ncbi:MAG: ATP-dependent sacrificial sulfur transferase LarE [Methanothrix sp.]|nr:ATP-dependent sacrificial sulfur transferase LarE [Methanothrix sp.]